MHECVCGGGWEREREREREGTTLVSFCLRRPMLSNVPARPNVARNWTEKDIYSPTVYNT